MARITRNATLTFGKHKGTKISMCPTSYLRWMGETLMDSDLHRWAQAARDELDVRQREGALETEHKSLEQQADDLLRKAGFKP